MDDRELHWGAIELGLRAALRAVDMRDAKSTANMLLVVMDMLPPVPEPGKVLDMQSGR
jgi:hypothetical protein